MAIRGGELLLTWAYALDAAAAKAEKMAAALAAELFDARPTSKRATAIPPSVAAN